MSAPTRSLFIPKLHDLLQASTLDGSQDLCWLNTDSFQISSNDTAARTALAPSWEFRSLSSFIRQLSYYGFTRLSDRRRSSARRTAVACKTIVFAHPSGHFIENDASRLHLIIRKCRARKADKDGVKKKKPAVATSRSKSPEHLQYPGEGENGEELEEGGEELEMLSGDGETIMDGDDYGAFLKSRHTQMDDWDRNRSSFDSVGSGVESMYSQSQPQSPTLPYYSVNYQEQERYRPKFGYGPNNGIGDQEFSHYPPPLGYGEQAAYPLPPQHYLPPPEIYNPSHLPPSSYIHHSIHSHDHQHHDHQQVHHHHHPLHSAGGNTIYHNRDYHLESYSINQTYTLPEKATSVNLSPSQKLEHSPKSMEENHYFQNSNQQNSTEEERIPRSVQPGSNHYLDLENYPIIINQPTPIAY